MADSAGLTGDAAAVDAGDDVELADGVGGVEGLVDDQLEGVKSEIIVDIAAVDADSAASGIKTHAGNRLLSSACAVEIGLRAGV